MERTRAFRHLPTVGVLGALAAFSCAEDVDDPDFGGNGNGGGDTQSGTEDGGTSDSSSGTASGGTTAGPSGTSSGTTGSNCGNGAIDPGESCDGANLGGETCESLGEGSGTLGCDPVMCTFDTSMCSGSGSSTSGG